MHKHAKITLCTILIVTSFFMISQTGWAQSEITFAGVTHLRTPSNESYTNLGLGINFDSGNFKVAGDPYAELEKIAPYAVNAQLKVEVVIDGKKQHSDIPRVVSILKNAGYSGWIALEYEAAEDPLEAIPGWLKQLDAAIG